MKEKKGENIKLLSYALYGLSMLSGGGSIILWAIFLYLGAFGILDMGFSTMGAILFDSAISLLFFLQHSLMTRTTIKKIIQKIVPELYYAAVYSIVSGITLTASILLWQKIPVTLASADGVMTWMIRAIYFAGLAGVVQVIISLKGIDSLGVKKIRHHLSGTKQKPVPLAIGGLYRWVRHPIYFCSIVMIWAHPVLTVDKFLYDVIWTIWMVIGTMLEERDLLVEFGDSYRAYREKAPMLIPYKIPGNI